MAGTIVHLAVAVQLDRRFCEEPERWLGAWAAQYRREDFFAGNICPDGIMARKDYKREMKLHTHMRDGIPDGTFQEPENLAMFRHRLKQFFQENIQRPNVRFSLYLGYLTHMLTDEKFILERHPEVLKRIAQTGFDRKNPETYVKFGRDVDAVDFRLIKEFPDISEAYRALKKVEPYEITGWITKEELSASREWILEYFFETPHELSEPLFLPYEQMREFITDVTEEICGKLARYLNAEDAP